MLWKILRFAIIWGIVSAMGCSEGWGFILAIFIDEWWGRRKQVKALEEQIATVDR